MASQPEDSEADSARGGAWRHPLRIALLSALLGAIVGSLLTFALPLVWTYFTAPPAPPTVLNVTPEQLTSWHKGINHAVQARVLAEQMYYDKWVRWEGEVSAIGDFLTSKGMLNFRNFSATCSREQVQAINVGDKVRVLGRLSMITNDHVFLSDCQPERLGEVFK